MNNNFSTESKHNPSHRQLPPQVVEILQDREEFYRQLEAEGCPPATVARFRRATCLALTRTLAESKRRDFLLSGINDRIQKLKPKRLFSGPPPGSSEALDKIEDLASELPDEAEKQIVLRRVEQLRGCLPERCGR